MKNFNWNYVKQNKVMFGVIVVVFGILFWFLISRGGGGSGGGNTYVESGPSDAQVAAQTSLGLAQIQAASQTQGYQAQLSALSLQADTAQAIAILESQVSLAELAASERIGEKQLVASVEALSMQLQTQVAVTEANNQFMVDYARVAADSALDQVKINALLQADLAAKQLEGFKYQSALSQIGTLKKKDRDNALAGYLGYTIPNDPKRSGGGGLFSVLGKAATGIVGAVL